MVHSRIGRPSTVSPTPNAAFGPSPRVRAVDTPHTSVPTGAVYDTTAEEAVVFSVVEERQIVSCAVAEVASTISGELRDHGAEVVILEKQPEETHFSNTRMSGGGFHSPDPAGDFDSLKAYAKAMFSGDNLPHKLEGEQSEFADELRRF